MKIAEFKKTYNTPLKQATLCLLVKNNQILLAMKKRGFGVGRWNGYGGKPKDGETIEETAIRETKEESGVTIKSLKKVAILDFYFLPRPEISQKVIVFLVEDWEGELLETEEMAPRWYKKDELPFSEMWPDDIHWLPSVLKGKRLEAQFLFGEKDSVLDLEVKEKEVL